MARSFMLLFAVLFALPSSAQAQPSVSSTASGVRLTVHGRYGWLATGRRFDVGVGLSIPLSELPDRRLVSNSATEPPGAPELTDVSRVEPTMSVPSLPSADRAAQRTPAPLQAGRDNSAARSRSVVEGGEGTTRLRSSGAAPLLDAPAAQRLAFNQLNAPAAPTDATPEVVVSESQSRSVQQSEGEGAEASDPAEAPPEVPVIRVLSSDAMREVVRLALKFGMHRHNQQRIEALTSRSRWSAALPQLSVRAGRSSDASLRWSPSTDDPYRYTQAGGTDLFLEGRVSWKLDRLVFADEELRLETLRLQQLRERAEFVEDVLEKLFEWQNARLEADAAPLAEERALYRLKAEVAQAWLDVVTNGHFSRRFLKAAKRKRTPRK